MAHWALVDPVAKAIRGLVCQSTPDYRVPCAGPASAGRSRSPASALGGSPFSNEPYLARPERPTFDQCSFRPARYGDSTCSDAMPSGGAERGRRTGPRCRRRGQRDSDFTIGRDEAMKKRIRCSRGPQRPLPTTPRDDGALSPSTSPSTPRERGRLTARPDHPD